MTFRRRRRALRRRFGRSYDSRGRLLGARRIDELLEEEAAPTQRVPRMTMQEEIEAHRREREREHA